MKTTLPRTTPQWVITDASDCQQRGRQLETGVFEFQETRTGQAQVQAVIRLSDYSDQQLAEAAAAYYGSVQELKDSCGMGWECVLAECIFEQKPL